jgi:hypothetical protein
MCKKFEFIVEDMSDEDANALWNVIVKFVEDRGLLCGGTSSPWDKNVDEVENVVKANS